MLAHGFPSYVKQRRAGQGSGSGKGSDDDDEDEGRFLAFYPAAREWRISRVLADSATARVGFESSVGVDDDNDDTDNQQVGASALTAAAAQAASCCVPVGVRVWRWYEEGIIIKGWRTAEVRVASVPLAQADVTRAAAAARERAQDAAASK